MKDFKSLIYTRPKASPITGESSNQGENASSQMLISDSGYEDSRSANGSQVVLATCLKNVYHGFNERCRKDEYYQKKLKEPFLSQQEVQKTELLKRNTAREIKQEEIEKIREKVRKLENDIIQVKVNPDSYGINAIKKPKAQFYIGLLVLLPITIYLVVFYISASYSAFFKDFDTSKLSAAIFDAQAYSKALDEGWLEAVFVSTIPFTFMGLGFLVHMFQKEGKSGIFKIIGLFIVTFIFDCILAYLIENKIYEFGKSLDSKPFNLSIAFKQVEFWGIIFAGFVVYVIWGLVFDFVMKEFENIDKINTFIRRLREEKSTAVNVIEEIEKKIDQIKIEAAAISGKIAELQATLDSFIFSNREYLLYHSSYVRGWMLAISKELHLTRDEFQNLTNKCTEVSEKHLNDHGIGSSEQESNVLQIAI